MNNDNVDSGFLNLFNKKPRDNQDASKDNANNISDDSDSEAIGPIISIPTEEIFYQTNHPNIGIALIFNHTDIIGQSKRLGTDKDKKRVKKALRSMGFEVRIYDDLTFGEINGILTTVGKEDHSKNDCFMAIVMSHGISGEIFAKDMTYPVERLWSPFLGKNCKTLRNKPKLFFIQACRGDKLESPVQYKDSFTVMSRGIDVHDAPTKPVIYSIPNTADLLVMYSTFEGTYSWRNPVNGSWFIQSLSHVLEEAIKSEEQLELMYLLTAVNRKVAYEYQSFMPQNEKFDEMKEMPNFVSTLTKIFKFKPKY